MRASITYQLARVQVRLLAELPWSWQQRRAERVWGEAGPLALLAQPRDRTVGSANVTVTDSASKGSTAASGSNVTGSDMISIYIRKNIIEKAILRPFMSTTVPLPSVSLYFSDCSCCPPHSMCSNGFAKRSVM